MTIRPKDNRLFILQTIPGMVFRNLYITMDELNALRWFRQEVDHLSAKHHSRDSLEDKQTVVFWSYSQCRIVLNTSEKITILSWEYPKVFDV